MCNSISRTWTGTSKALPFKPGSHRHPKTNSSDTSRDLINLRNSEFHYTKRASQLVGQQGSLRGAEGRETAAGAGGVGQAHQKGRNDSEWQGLYPTFALSGFGGQERWHHTRVPAGMRAESQGSGGWEKGMRRQSVAAVRARATNAYSPQKKIQQSTRSSAGQATKFPLTPLPLALRTRLPPLLRPGCRLPCSLLGRPLNASIKASLLSSPSPNPRSTLHTPQDHFPRCSLLSLLSPHPVYPICLASIMYQSSGPLPPVPSMHLFYQSRPPAGFATFPNSTRSSPQHPFPPFPTLRLPAVVCPVPASSGAQRITAEPSSHMLAMTSVPATLTPHVAATCTPKHRQS